MQQSNNHFFIAIDPIDELYFDDVVRANAFIIKKLANFQNTKTLFLANKISDVNLDEFELQDNPTLVVTGHGFIGGLVGSFNYYELATALTQLSKELQPKAIHLNICFSACEKLSQTYQPSLENSFMGILIECLQKADVHCEVTGLAGANLLVSNKKSIIPVKNICSIDTKQALNLLHEDGNILFDNKEIYKIKLFDAVDASEINRCVVSRLDFDEAKKSFCHSSPKKKKELFEKYNVDDGVVSRMI